MRAAGSAQISCIISEQWASRQQSNDMSQEDQNKFAVCLTEWGPCGGGKDSKTMRKNLWLAVILLALHLVLGQDWEITNTTFDKNKDVWETTANCPQENVTIGFEKHNKTKTQEIKFHCNNVTKERCDNQNERCRLPDLNDIKRLLNDSDFNNVTELYITYFKLELPGDLFTIFPNVVKLYLRYTDPVYESGGKWPENLTLLETYQSTNLNFPKVSSIKELEIERPCKCSFSFA